MALLGGAAILLLNHAVPDGTTQLCRKHTLLRDVITIADEVDSQLKPAMLGYAEPGPIAVSAA